MLQTNPIMKQNQINCLLNTKENWWVLFGSTSCQLIDMLQPKTGNPIAIWF